MKKLLLISSLFSAILCSAESVLMSVTVNEHSVSQKIDLENDTVFGNCIKGFRLFLDEKIACAISILSRNEDCLALKVKVYAEDTQGNFTLIAEPVLLANWDKEAKVSLSNTTSTNTFTFLMTVLASK
jgi:hypothetical protein